MRRKKRGQGELQVWFFALLFLFMISLVYLVMTKPYIMVRDKFEANFTGSEFESTFDKINTYWKVWPVILVTSVFLWAIMSTLRDRPNFPRI
ncbi:hypothetical protein LCGC14_2982220 [marine sediment metagenome]|uniref:Uncharacterized protein n=1 Tax=marine sediment metagenome TaxID=412755 RepID=A0A0F8XTS6_9ZZZZ